MDSIISNTYLYPEVFIENTYSHRCILEISEEYYLIVNYRDRSSYNYRRYFGLVPYESVLEYIDLVESINKKGIIIARRTMSSLTGLLLESTTKLCLVEIKGYEPVITVSEWEEILEKDRIAYIITGKNEVRVFKSPCSGLLIFVINISWEKPSKYILVVVDKNACRRISIREIT